MTEGKIIYLLKKRDKSVLTTIYVENKASFISYAHKFSLSNEVIVDIYQDAIIALYENAIEGKLNNLKCSIKTYLFSIGKNMIYKQLRKDKKIAMLNTHALKDDYNEPIDYNIEQLTDKQIQLQKGFKQLGEQCKKILTLFYYRGYTLEEIMQTLNYRKKDVVKSQKSRCLAKLKSIINN